MAWPCPAGYDLDLCPSGQAIGPQSHGGDESMKPIKRQHLTATIFPASMLNALRKQSRIEPSDSENEIVFLTGTRSAQCRCVHMIAEEFARSGKTVRVL